METTKNIFEETVISLTEDSLSLQKKFKTLQEKNDFRGAIDIMRLMKDTLSLIKEYDWQTMYSEYSTDGHKEVAVWEQNHCGEIKNHKKWNVSELETEYSNKWINLLDKFIRNKQSMVFQLHYGDNDEEKLHRCTGKSTAIEYLSNKYNLPIFTSKFRAGKYNKENYRIKKVAYSNFCEFRGSYTNVGIVLVDEGFSDDELYDDLIENRGLILIGFKKA